MRFLFNFCNYLDNSTFSILSLTTLLLSPSYYMLYLQNAGSAEPWTGYRDHSVGADRGQGWLPHPGGLLPGLPMHSTHRR